MEPKSFFQNQSTKITLKLALIVILVFFLLVPQVLILNLIDERQEINNTVTKEVSSGWANDQLITGPTLVIPYYLKNQKGNDDLSTKSNLIIFPENMDIFGDVKTQSKYRNLYKVLLYDSKLKFKVKFVIPDVQVTNLQNARMEYRESYIVTGISDLKGIQDNVVSTWQGQKTSVKPGINGINFRHYLDTHKNHPDYTTEGNNYTILKTGLSSAVNIDNQQKEYDFTFDIDIKGSQTLLFSPIAKHTMVHIKSSFPDPSFIGDFLPEHVTNEKGFDAKWKVFEYNKSLPPFQKSNDVIDIGSNVFGVKIAETIDNYSKSYRAGKYMILFVLLTFLSVFLTEVVQKLNIHIFQYTLIGLALAIFFILLLSISEFWGFDVAYWISACATIGLIFLYTLSMFGNKKSSFLLLGLLTTLFGYIYVIIQLEKTALLAGSIGLFITISSTMYVTRKIKWYETEETI